MVETANLARTATGVVLPLNHLEVGDARMFTRSFWQSNSDRVMRLPDASPRVVLTDGIYPVITCHGVGDQVLVWSLFWQTENKPLHRMDQHQLSFFDHSRKGWEYGREENDHFGSSERTEFGGRMLSKTAWCQGLLQILSPLAA